ncbi:MAG: tRNA (adenosine(37)-N6)-dimethylallyltransferase MiaA [Alphaproteobacteria bacterium]
MRSVVIIAGPTASGKSRMAVDIAREFNGTVINADSMQVYRELDLLTARPSAAELEQAEHRLYGVLPAAEPCSVGRWLDMATVEIEDAWKQDRLAVVVGGTGMYLKALMQGLAPIPDVPDAAREEATALYERLGGEEFVTVLAKFDADAAARIPPADRQRLIRAYEVLVATGRTLTEWQAEHPSSPPLDADFALIAVIPERGDLYASVDARFDAMMAAGALDEVRALLDLKLDPQLPAMKAIGVKELAAHLGGEVDLATATANAAQATRNFAKRQLTWVRNQQAPDLVISAQYSERFQAEIFSFIRQFMLTRHS